MFNKIIVIDPMEIVEESKNKLNNLAKEVIFFDTLAETDEEKIQRIGDAEAVLVSYRGSIGGAVIKACTNLKYIGMCCTLYSAESANVDIITAKKMGIEVLGISHYGDNGVIEFIVGGLIRLIHGFGSHQWREEPYELDGLNIGVIGMGNTGYNAAKALNYFGANISYYDRVEKEFCKNDGFELRSLYHVLKDSDVIITCLNRNTKVLFEEEFKIMGSGKILINTSISPTYDIDALEKWLSDKSNYYICDSDMALGDENGKLIKLDNLICSHKASGGSHQEKFRFAEKIIENIEKFLSKNSVEV